MRSASRITATGSRELDKKRAELEGQFPGWGFEYVLYPNGDVTWKARPRPLLVADSPEELAAKIIAAHEAAAEWPALADRADYAGVAPGVSQAGLARP